MYHKNQANVGKYTVLISVNWFFCSAYKDGDWGCLELSDNPTMDFPYLDKQNDFSLLLKRGIPF